MVRSSDLMSRDDTALLVVDVQEKLIPLVRGQATIVWNIRRLIDGAKALGVTAFATEQYPRALGPTVSPLVELFDDVPEKLSFSCGGCEPFTTRLKASERYKVLITGVETHVCVQQTALDLMTDGYQVYLAIDAVGARHELDHTTALRRLETCGANLTTTEAALFEWCEVAGTKEFKQISSLAKEKAPSAET